jgi:cytochrome c biogenesis protein CcmG/thiol:disulfide interchange protein DsbE
MLAGRTRAAMCVTAGLVAVAALAISACGGERPPVARSPVASGTAGKPLDEPALRSLEQQSSEILDGGVPAFERRLAALEGHPIVVNQWASWCGPCREEFPFFQRLAEEYRGEVAFLGVDSQDSRDEAEAFLEEFPTPYPHYFDPDTEVARVFGGGRAWPTTAFYDQGGGIAFVHQGAYATEQQLEEDIRRYAIRGG